MALTTDPLPNLTAVDVIQDKERMKRLKASLCSGILEYADNDAAARIMEECLKICGGSAEILSGVVQQKLILDHTPFHWTLVNRRSKSMVPPLFAKLVRACDELCPDTQEEIMEFVHKKSDLELYAIVQDKIAEPARLPAFELSNHSFFQEACDQPSVTVNSLQEEDSEYGRRHGWHSLDFRNSGDLEVTQTVSFNIPKFIDRLIVDEEVWIQFLAMGSLFRVTALIIAPDHINTHSRLQFQIADVPSGSYGNRSQAPVRVNLAVTVGSPLAVDALHMSYSTNLSRGSGESAILSEEGRKLDKLAPLIQSSRGRNVSGHITLTR